jgi:hypothetical protein
LRTGQILVELSGVLIAVVESDVLSEDNDISIEHEILWDQETARSIGSEDLGCR